MKILSVHNSYQTPGGEDQVFAQEADLLRAHGHKVLLYHTSNEQVTGKNSLVLLGNTIWNKQTHSELLDLMQRERPDVVHVHNTFPVISPLTTMLPMKPGFRLYKPSTISACFVPQAPYSVTDMSVKIVWASAFLGPGQSMVATAAAGWPPLLEPR